MKEALEVSAIDALLEAGKRLQDINPEALAVVLAAARAYVAIYDRPDESDEVFASRIREIAQPSGRLLD